MKSFFFICLLTLLSLHSQAQYSTGDPPLMKGFHDYVHELLPETTCIIDTNGTLSLEDIRGKSGFLLSKAPFGRRIPRKLTEYPFYYRFTIKNPAQDSFRAFFYPGMYHRSMELYRFENGQIAKVNQSADHRKDGFVYLSVAAGNRDSFLLKILFSPSPSNVTSARLIDPRFIDTYIRQLSTYAYSRKIIGFLIAGSLFMMFLFGLLNYISSGRKEFFYNALYSALMFFIVYTVAQYYNRPGKIFGEFFSFWWLISLCVGFIFYIQFTRKFLDTENQQPAIDRLLRIEIYTLLFLIVVYFPVHFMAQSPRLDELLENIMKFTVLTISLLYVILGLRNNKRLINYLALGSAVQVIFSVVSLLLVKNSSDTNRVHTSSVLYFELGVVISQLFFLLGLAYKNRMELIGEVRNRELMRMNMEKMAYENKLAVIEAKQQERNRISADMHDDLGAGMTTIRLFSELARKKLGDTPIPEIDKISSAANELLIKMNAIIWSMADSNDTLDNMVAYIRSYSLEYLDKFNIQCQVDIPERLPKIVVNGEIRRNVFLIIKEALNNIVKHAQASNVDIRLNKEPLGMSLTIHDDGVGINPEKMRRFGNGLKNMKKRMQDMGGEFSIESREGTRIRLYVQTRF